MYQARRVADPIAQPPAAVSAESAALPARALAHTPRHAVPTFADRAFTKGGVALAVLTAAATAGAVRGRGEQR